MPASAAAWTDLGDGVLVRRSAAFQMNSVLLLDRAQTVLVDPGILPSELDDLARATREAGPARTLLAFTHAHWDHVLGKPWWPQAETLGHDRFAATVRRDAEHIAREAETLATKHGERWQRGFEPFRLKREVSGLHFLKLDPWKLVFRDAPGHDATSLTIHLPDRRTLIAGDLLSDIEIPALDEPPHVMRRTLEELRLLARNGAIETLVPGHGSIARDAAEVNARIDRDLAYLESLEAGVREAHGRGLPLEGAQERLAAMDYLGKHEALSELSMPETHRDNVRLTYEALLEVNGRRRAP